MILMMDDDGYFEVVKFSCLENYEYYEVRVFFYFFCGGGKWLLNFMKDKVVVNWKGLGLRMRLV